MMVRVVVNFGSTTSGFSDDGRVRHGSTAISPSYAKQILRLQEAGTAEAALHPIVAKAITASCFTGWGSQRDELVAHFTDGQSTERTF
jgi:hypothetical protein